VLLKPVSSRGTLSLSDEAAAPPAGLSKGDELEAKFEKVAERLGELQQVLYADGHHALLIVLQGRDAAGKDSVTATVFDACNAQGVRVDSFKAPTAIELAHDYLWRIHNVVPEKRMIGIFNRSHYEDVLIVRVHGLVPETIWRARYEQINAFERLLFDNGVVILKFCLHISREEQRQRLLARLDDPEKNWKFNEGDLSERKRWDDYTAAYQDALAFTSTTWAPWYMVPADRKPARDLLTAEVLLDKLTEMNPVYPPVPKEVAAFKALLGA